MEAPAFLGQVPAYFHDARQHVEAFGNKMKEKLAPLGQRISASENWINHGKPLYERYIQPLDKTDYTLLGVCSALAMVILFIGHKALGIAILPLALGAAVTTIMGSWAFSRWRVNKRFDNVAWDHVDKIRRAAHETTHENQNFADIYLAKGLLTKPEFDHLDKERQRLDDEIQKFRAVILKPHFEKQQKIVKAHIEYLKTLVPANPHDKAILETLEQQVDKVRTKQEDLGALEIQKQKLNDLQTAAAKNHHFNLGKQVDDMIQASQAPAIMDTKKAFNAYLTALQNRLSHKQVEELLDENNPKKEEIKNDQPQNPLIKAEIEEELDPAKIIEPLVIVQDEQKKAEGDDKPEEKKEEQLDESPQGDPAAPEAHVEEIIDTDATKLQEEGVDGDNKSEEMKEEQLDEAPQSDLAAPVAQVEEKIDADAAKPLEEGVDGDNKSEEEKEEQLDETPQSDLTSPEAQAEESIDIDAGKLQQEGVDGDSKSEETKDEEVHGNQLEEKDDDEEGFVIFEAKIEESQDNPTINDLDNKFIKA